MKPLIYIGLLLLSAFPLIQEQDAPKLPKQFNGKVVGVHDGDTMTILVNNKEYKVRLAEIDAPELGQAFGTKSKNQLSEMVFGQFVFGTVDSIDRYGRTVAHILTSKNRVNEDMVKSGFAWRFDKYSKSATLLRYQNDAKRKSLGLWADKDPIPPWQYRAEEELKRAREKAAKQRAEEEARKRMATKPPPSSLRSPASTTKKSPNEKKTHWMTIKTQKRHRRGCRFFGKSDGRACLPTEGVACKICGG